MFQSGLVLDTREQFLLTLLYFLNLVGRVLLAVTKINSYLHGCPSFLRSAWKNLNPTGWFYVKFYGGNFLLECNDKFKFYLKSDGREIFYMNTYVVGSKSFRPDIQKPRQMENAVRDIQGVSRL